MSWKCKDCGNDKEFEACATDYLKVVIDANGDYIRNVVGAQTGELIISDEGITCAKCDSENVVQFQPKQVELGAAAGGE